MHWVCVDIEEKGKYSCNKSVKGAEYVFVAEYFLPNVVEEYGKNTF